MSNIYRRGNKGWLCNMESILHLIGIPLAVLGYLVYFKDNIRSI